MEYVYMTRVELCIATNTYLFCLLLSLRAFWTILFYFFFFQAEDGIRDFHVTGVQTCALPISCASSGRRRPLSRISTGSPVRRLRPQPNGVPMSRRSEERRVGKECRSRWS